MERILVGVGPHNQNLWSAVHAMGLAKRMNAKVSFLLVLEPGPKGEEQQTPYRRKLEAFIEQVRSEGLTVDYYVSQGDYEDELVRFVKEHKVTMLVIDQPLERGGRGGRGGRGARGGRGVASVESANFIEKIRHRVDCRIEVVQETGRGPINST